MMLLGIKLNLKHTDFPVFFVSFASSEVDVTGRLSDKVKYDNLNLFTCICIYFHLLQA